MAKRKPMLPHDYNRLEGMHYLSAGKETVAGLFATYDEACRAKEVLFPTGQHPESEARVEVGYHPTRKQLRRWDRINRTLRALDVRYWQVVEDRKTERGRCIGYPISKMFSTRQECRKALAQIKGANPRAYMGCATCFFHWARPEEMRARKALLDEIRGIR